MRSGELRGKERQGGERFRIRNVGIPNGQCPLGLSNVCRLCESNRHLLSLNVMLVDVSASKKHESDYAFHLINSARKRGSGRSFGRLEGVHERVASGAREFYDLVKLAYARCQ